MSEKDSKVVSILDRRASKAVEEEAEPAPEVLEPSPRERNADVKPMVVNRNEVDPRELIRGGRGTARDRDRAILLLDRRCDQANRNIATIVREFDKTREATGQGFREYLSITEQVINRQDAIVEWHHRPWYRRIFRKPPALPKVELLTDGTAVEVHEDAAAASPPAEIQQAPEQPPAETSGGASTEAPPPAPEVTIGGTGNLAQDPEPTKPVVH
jgi:hypothetical protein